MNKNNLSSRELDLLKSILEKSQPTLLPKLEALKNGGLGISDIEDLQQLLSTEFVDAGLNDDDEPNKYGAEIDDLIGRLGGLNTAND